MRSSSGAVLSSVEGQVTAPDGSRLYATSRRDGGSTSLEARDSSTGEVLSTTTLRGPLDVRAASLTGRAVALLRPPAGVDTTYALPRRYTTIVVADPTGEEARAAIG